MTRQNVSRLQALQRGAQSFARIRQCYTQNREIYPVARRQLGRCSSGVHINALAVHFDQKRERFAANPVGSMLWRPRLRVRLIKCFLPKLKSSWKGWIGLIGPLPWLAAEGLYEAVEAP